MELLFTLNGQSSGSVSFSPGQLFMIVGVYARLASIGIRARPSWLEGINK